MCTGGRCELPLPNGERVGVRGAGREVPAQIFSEWKRLERCGFNRAARAPHPSLSPMGRGRPFVVLAARARFPI
jgi:hypothetical protein